MEKLREYFLATRPYSFPATFAPIFIGSSFSLFYIEKFNFINFTLFLLICLLIQAGTNLFNEYYDYKSGLDKIDSQGIAGSIVKNKLSAKEVFMEAVLLYCIAFILGVILSFYTSMYLLLVGSICMLVGYIYTGGKYPIAYSPFGEIVSGFFMGTMIIVISYYLQTSFINLDVLIISIPMFILIGNMLMANSIRDLDNDKVSGRKTFAIIVGKNRAIKVMAFSYLLVYILSLLFVLIKYASFYNLLIFLTIPLAINIIAGLKNNITKEKMAPYMILSAQLTIAYGLLTSLAYILNYII
ncbi:MULTISPECIES: 1,4-dihydroxy-2-naphthoate polyprenyltransferase [unclassified Gemella]|uniref:1,4-dihydroxy-2-naphthoate polyprenyltransferase n=1 Tax=unclassified Gemella TaxID=2624949 RepID=UPI00207B6AB8|nr:MULTISPECIES: 1,4-dihydroxy-2-naphthoate polyprenyltransferase [unclassified Gemella]